MKHNNFKKHLQLKAMSDDKNYTSKMLAKYRPSLQELWDETITIKDFINEAKYWGIKFKEINLFLKYKNLNPEADWNKLNGMIK